jgi:hypothetical protein
VSGAVALLLQRHPDWTVADVKSALVATADPLAATASAPTRTGTGLVDLVQADAPLLAAAPTALSLGPLAPGAQADASVDLSDAGGGTGLWSVRLERLVLPPGSVVQAPPVVEVPGTLDLVVLAGDTAGEGSGVVRLRLGEALRRVPFWFRVSAPSLAEAPVRRVARPGEYRGDTRGRSSLVETYRYPQVRSGGPVTALLAGPEQVFRLRIDRPVANFGVAIVARAPSVLVEPRVMAAGDESRLTGFPGLPVNVNPYQVGYGEGVLVAGAVRPAPGAYDIVFDSRTAAGAGAFTFRLWVDDVTPPAARLVTRSVRRGEALRLRVSDAGSGVDPASVVVAIDGVERNAEVRGGEIVVATGAVMRGLHRLRVQVSDYQETRNTENVGRILPNTRVLRAGITIR